MLKPENRHFFIILLTRVFIIGDYFRPKTWSFQVFNVIYIRSIRFPIIKYTNSDRISMRKMGTAWCNFLGSGVVSDLYFDSIYR